MKVLVAGAGGMLGRDLVAALAERWEVVGVDLPQCDLSDAGEAKRTFLAHRPDWVVNCAAYTAVDKAEEEPARAAAANIDAAHNVARACGLVGARLIHLSTDYVFDGAKPTPYLPGDPTGPLSVYGRTKRDGEVAVLAALGERAAVLRTAWLHGPHGASFVAAILRQIDAGKPLKVVDDQRGSPTFTGHLALAIRAAIEAGLLGIHHATGGGDCTWFEFARAICELLGRPDWPLTPVKTADMARPAPRPANSRLDNSSFNAATGFELPTWRAGLVAHLTCLGRFSADADGGG